MARGYRALLDAMHRGYEDVAVVSSLAALVRNVRRFQHRQSRFPPHDAFLPFHPPSPQLPLQQSGATATGIAQMGTAIPAAGMQTLIGMCEAAALTLQGVRNAIHPGSRRELELKYKGKDTA